MSETIQIEETKGPKHQYPVLATMLRGGRSRSKSRRDTETWTRHASLTCTRGANIVAAITRPRTETRGEAAASLSTHLYLSCARHHRHASLGFSRRKCPRFRFVPWKLLAGELEERGAFEWGKSKARVNRASTKRFERYLETKKQAAII